MGPFQLWSRHMVKKKKTTLWSKKRSGTSPTESYVAEISAFSFNNNDNNNNNLWTYCALSLTWEWSAAHYNYITLQETNNR